MLLWVKVVVWTFLYRRVLEGHAQLSSILDWSGTKQDILGEVHHRRRRLFLLLHRMAPSEQIVNILHQCVQRCGRALAELVFVRKMWVYLMAMLLIVCVNDVVRNILSKSCLDVELAIMKPKELRVAGESYH